MMPTVGPRMTWVEIMKGRVNQPRMSPIRTLTQLLLMAWIRTIFRMHTCRLRGCMYSMNVMDLSSTTQNHPFQIFTDLFPDEIMDLLVSETNSCLQRHPVSRAARLPLMRHPTYQMQLRRPLCHRVYLDARPAIVRRRRI